MAWRPHPDTVAVGHETASAAGDVTLPIHLSSTDELAGLDGDLSLDDLRADLERGSAALEV